MAAKSNPIINPCREVFLDDRGIDQFIHLDTHKVGSNIWHTILVNDIALDWIQSNFISEEDFFARKTDLFPLTIIVNEKILVLMTLKWRT